MNTQAKRVAVAVNAKQIEDAVANGKQAVEKTLEVSRSQLEKATKVALKSYDDAASNGKEQIDVLVRSSTVVARGAEEISRAVFELAQANAEAQVEFAKSLFAVKTINDWVELQNEYVRNNFDKIVADSARISEMGLKVANDVVSPLQGLANASFEKFSKQFAA